MKVVMSLRCAGIFAMITGLTCLCWLPCAEGTPPTQPPQPTQRPGAEGSINNCAASTAETKVPGVEIQINVQDSEDNDDEKDDFICKTNAPGLPQTRCRARLQNAFSSHVEVELKNEAGGGEVRFPNETDETKTLTLDKDQAWADFYISGKTVSSAKDDAKIVAYKKGSTTSILGRQELTVFKVDITHISFNYKTTSATDDALNIRENLGTAITLPEYVNCGQNKPAAYVKGKTVKINVRMKVDPSDITSVNIKGVSTDTNGSLGDAAETAVTFARGVSDEGADDTTTSFMNEKEYVEFSVGTTPSKILASTESWRWVATKVETGTLPDVELETTSGHKIYTIWDDPKSPWSTTYNDTMNPWVSALDFAINDCNANFAIYQNSAMMSITRKLESTFQYRASPEFIRLDSESDALYFHYSSYITVAKNPTLLTAIANCVDQAFGLKTTFAVLGFPGLSYKHSPWNDRWGYHCYVKDGDEVWDSTHGLLTVGLPQDLYNSRWSVSGNPRGYCYSDID